jgi:hypothetical protein
VVDAQAGVLLDQQSPTRAERGAPGGDAVLGLWEVRQEVAGVDEIGGGRSSTVRSAWRNSASGTAALACSRKAADESMPIVRLGWVVDRTRAVVAPGPQPRSSATSGWATASRTRKRRVVGWNVAFSRRRRSAARSESPKA